MKTNSFRDCLDDEQLQKLDSLIQEAKAMSKQDPPAERDKVVESYKKGNWKRCFALAENLKKTFNKNEINSIALAYESMGTSRKMYEKLGVNVDGLIEEAKNIIKNRLSINNVG